MNAEFQQRLVETLTAIGAYATVGDLRTRGNIAKPAAYLATELEAGRKAGTFLKCAGKQDELWGLARWPSAGSISAAPGGGRSPVKPAVKPVAKSPPGEMQARVLGLLQSNQHPKDIAEILGINVTTVAYHKRQLTAKGLLPSNSKRTTTQEAPARAKGDSMSQANDGPHPALEELSEVFDKLEPVTIADPEPKLALLLKYAAFLKQRGAFQAEQLALQIHNDIAAAAHLPLHIIQL